MMEENLMLAWQFIAVTTTICMVFLAWGNTNKQKEINMYLQDNLDLMKENNKHMSEIIKLRTALKKKGHLYQDLEEKLVESQRRTTLNKAIKLS